MPPTATPFQLVKAVYGLRDEHLLLPTKISHDHQLMAMDAPEIFPAGSMRRSPCLGTETTAFESLAIRPAFHFRSQQ